MAARAVRIKVIGFAGLDRTLKRQPERIKQRVVKPALRRSLAVVQQRAKQFAPKDTHELEESIVRRIVETKNRLSGFVQARADHAMPQEYGWTLPDGGEAPGQPFMRPALQESRADAHRIFVKEIRRELARECRCFC